MAKNTKDPLIVAIGTSAGGVSALEELCKILRSQEEMSYVIIQHLSPEPKSELSSILQRHTKINVKWINSKLNIEPNHIYIAPPHHFVNIQNNHFELIPFEKSDGKKIFLPIDQFLRSLADEKKERSVAIILTGSGSDGTLGIREIKEAGGLVIVQDPATADFKGMPESAIDTGLVDAELNIQDIPRYLVNFNKIIKKSNDLVLTDEEQQKPLEKIFDLIQRHSGHHFSDYKKTTILRRIQKRMAVKNEFSLEKYASLLENNSSEINFLIQELLIGVTSFFRDFEAFKILEESVFPVLTSPHRDDQIRIWIAACSTGEEVYSIAILLKNYLIKHKIHKEIQIFATDIDKSALEKARAGRYNLNVKMDIPEHLLNRYFEKKEFSYVIHKQIRDMIVFAEHNILSDPTYSSIDLISCRNFLIYIEPEAQKHTLNTFHYALKSGGFLFLGGSETQRISDDVFKTIDRKSRIFKKIDNRQVFANYILQSKKDNRNRKLEEIYPKPAKKEFSYKEFLEKIAINNFLHPVLLINKKGEILYSLGKCEEYFKFHVGEAKNSILNNAREGLKVPISNALRKINSTKKKLIYKNVPVFHGNNERSVELVIQPIETPTAFNSFFIVSITPLSNKKEPDKNAEKTEWMPNERENYITQMENELAETREYLRNIVEELETSNEELKSANEESQSTNEELQSSKEELESSKEELQSVNEELTISNLELKRRVEESSQYASDLKNFLYGIDIGILFIDKELKIKRFTPQVRHLINLEERDIGRSISDFNISFVSEKLIQDIHHVIENLDTIEKEIQSDSNSQFWMRIKPYRTIDDKIDGAVVTFTDITEKNLIQKRPEFEKRRYKLLFNYMDVGIAIFEPSVNSKKNIEELKFLEINKTFENLMRVNGADILGHSSLDIFRDKKFHEKLLSGANNAVGGTPAQKEHYFQVLDKHLKITCLYLKKDKMLVVFFFDITSLKKEIETHQHLVSIIESTDDAIYSESIEGKILSWNDGAVQVYGFSREEAIGNSTEELFKPSQNDNYLKILKKVRSGQKISNIESIHQRKDGSTVSLSLTKSPILDSNGATVAISNIAKDISVLKEREEILKAAKDSFEHASTLKSTFLANMSHEIRTPLNSIIGFTEILKEELKNEKHKKLLRNVSESGQQLLQLINDLIDFSRLEAKELPVHITNVDIVHLLQRTKEQFKGYCKRINKEKRIDFTLNINNEEKGKGRIILTDEHKLQQILYNLLSNAFKYTEEGLVEFGFDVLKEDLRFYVKDSGIGIEKEDFDKIFRRFQQSENISGKAISGTGLGLSIAKGLVEILGGKIWVESQKEKGSLFYFTLPLKEGNVSAKNISSFSSGKFFIPDLEGKEILLIEDDELSIEMIKFLLDKTGAKLSIATKGSEAVKLFEKKDYDLVLLDIRLPDKSGYEIIQVIREKNPELPVIAQSSFAFPDQIKKSLEAGFSDYITKPVSMEYFYSIINKFLG